MFTKGLNLKRGEVTYTESERSNRRCTHISPWLCAFLCLSHTAQSVTATPRGDGLSSLSWFHNLNSPTAPGVSMPRFTESKSWLITPQNAAPLGMVRIFPFIHSVFLFHFLPLASNSRTQGVRRLEGTLSAFRPAHKVEEDGGETLAKAVKLTNAGVRAPGGPLARRRFHFQWKPLTCAGNCGPLGRLPFFQSPGPL